MPMPTVSMYGSAMPGNASTSAAPTAIAATRSMRPRRDSELLGKSPSKEPLGPDGQRGEQREIEHGLRPGRAQRDLQEAHRHAEHHRGDRGAGHAAEPAD